VAIGSAPGIVVGVGVGAAAAAALEPAVELPRQKAWKDNPNRELDAGTLARLAAQGGITLAKAREAGERDGYDADKVDALTYLAQTVPELGIATALWRKLLIGDDLYEHVLTKLGFDTRYVQPLLARKHRELVGMGDIATAIVRGILPSPSWVPVPPPTGTTNVKRFPVVELNPVTLAGKLGFDEDMLQLMVGRAGLSMAPVMAAQARFRGILAGDDYRLAIAEGDLRSEWAQAVLDVSRQILTAGEYAELQLRGYYNRATRLEHTRKHGMTDADSDLLYDVQGRGLSLHQAFVGVRRGGTLNGSADAIPEWALYQLQRGNLRPEVYNIAYAGRETLPSAFVVRALLRDGAISEKEGETLFLHMGWPAGLASLTAAHYSAGSTAGAKGLTAAELTAEYEGHYIDAATYQADLRDLGYSAESAAEKVRVADARRVVKARDAAIARARSEYARHRISRAQLQAALQAEAIPEPAQDLILVEADHERELTADALTAAQIKKAYKGDLIERQTALDRLQRLGYDAGDDAIYLDE
jgi:hypothetical protein